MKAVARDSLLSRKQVEEISKELGISFETIYIKSGGDLDKTTSLQNLEKTNFFTKELDEMVLEHKVDFAIHSAKDLPDPLEEGLQIAYLGSCIDPKDSLVIHKWPLKTVGVSSMRRAGLIEELFPNAKCVDIRGTIEERLEKKLDGVVIAEAALLRLGLQDLLRIYLPGKTAKWQGRIALVAREKSEHLFGLKTPDRDLLLSCN